MSYIESRVDIFELVYPKLGVQLQFGEPMDELCGCSRECSLACNQRGEWPACCDALETGRDPAD